MDLFYKILGNILIENRVLTEEEVNIIICEYLNNNNLLYLVKKICIDKNNSLDNYAHYNCDRFSIYINLQKIYDLAVRNFKVISEEFDINFNSYYNFLLITTLFHELTHVYQYSEVFFYKESDYLDVYNLCFDLRINEDFYNKNSLLFPMEREACIKSVEIYLEALRYIGVDLVSKDELRYYQFYYLCKLLMDYDMKFYGVKCPLRKLLSNTSKMTRICHRGLLKKEKMSLHKRMALGLDISLDEYKSIYSIYQSICNDKLDSNDLVCQLVLKR